MYYERGKRFIYREMTGEINKRAYAMDIDRKPAFTWQMDKG
jgi:hypothetical protein